MAEYAAGIFILIVIFTYRLLWKNAYHQVERLKEAIQEYGDHDAVCNIYFQGECDCGFKEIEAILNPNERRLI